MTDFFATLVLGHLIGDYLLQDKWMAENKGRSSWVCLFHCAVYTFAVTAATWSSIHGWQWSLLVFATHFPVDRWCLADRWLAFIGGRSLQDFLDFGWEDIPANFHAGNYRVLRGGFTALVYAVTDNTMHLVLMYWGGQWLMSSI